MDGGDDGDAGAGADDAAAAGDRVCPSSKNSRKVRSWSGRAFLPLRPTTAIHHRPLRRGGVGGGDVQDEGADGADAAGADDGGAGCGAAAGKGDNGFVHFLLLLLLLSFLLPLCRHSFRFHCSPSTGRKTSRWCWSCCWCCWHHLPSPRYDPRHRRKKPLPTHRTRVGAVAVAAGGGGADCAGCPAAIATGTACSA